MIGKYSPMTDTTWAFAGAPSRRRGRPPSSDSAVTRERILQAARKVFAECGYEAATFQAIAVEVGLTRPAINNYFPSKSALYGEVVERAGEAVHRAVRRASAMPNLAGQLVVFLQQTARSDGTEPALAGFLVQAAIEAPNLSHPEAGAVAGHVERFVVGAVEEAVRRGTGAGNRYPRGRGRTHGTAVGQCLPDVPGAASGHQAHRAAARSTGVAAAAGLKTAVTARRRAWNNRRP